MGNYFFYKKLLAGLPLVLVHRTDG
uniref:Uncharacterized protein n=1 Tax=Anguilla anguilla TaxID=7936 RepID=A0A0E9S619_ANGAN